MFENEKKLRLQKEVQHLANLVAQQKFVEYVDHSNDSEKIVMESAKREDVSILTNIFTANLIQSDTRLTKPEFTAVARQFVCLPPVSNGESKLCVEKCGCKIEHCTKRTCKAGNEVLDAAGNHGLLCNPGEGKKSNIARKSS